MKQSRRTSRARARAQSNRVELFAYREARRLAECIDHDDIKAIAACRDWLRYAFNKGYAAGQRAEKRRAGSDTAALSEAK